MSIFFVLVYFRAEELNPASTIVEFNKIFLKKINYSYILKFDSNYNFEILYLISNVKYQNCDFLR